MTCSIFILFKEQERRGIVTNQCEVPLQPLVEPDWSVVWITGKWFSYMHRYIYKYTHTHTHTHIFFSDSFSLLENTEYNFLFWTVVKGHSFNHNSSMIPGDHSLFLTVALYTAGRAPGNPWAPKAWCDSIHILQLQSFPGGTANQEKQEIPFWSLGREDPLDKDMATHCSILAWRVPWTEEPGGLQNIGLRRVRHNWVTEHSLVHSPQPQTSELLVCNLNYFFHLISRLLIWVSTVATFYSNSCVDF